MNNQYQRALVEVGRIMVDYDTDKLIPAYGFGAKIPGSKEVSFCFPLSLDPKNPFVQSFEGLLQAYNAVVGSLQFLGPTNFAPIIRETKNAVQRGFEANKMVYSILLILTDGLITDFPDTVAEIIQCSRLPMSVIIVGVGNEDFKQMDMLDADVTPLRDMSGNSAVRDIVQFVPFREYAYQPHMLAEAVLRELPKQIDDFYQSIGIYPDQYNK